MSISISAIIPVYNSVSFIDKCLTSLMKQDYSLIEFIVIDDGSTDGSAEICDEYAKKDNRFHVYHQSNEGIASARDLGLRYAHGEYIAWVDSDDYVSENWIYSIISAIGKNHPDCLLFDYSILYTYGRQPIHFATSSQFLTQDAYVYELSCDYRIPSYLWRQVIKRDIWLNYHFPKGVQIMEDYQAFTKLAVYIRSIYYIHSLLYFYRQHTGSLTRTSNLSDSLKCLNIAQERYSFFSQYGYCVSKSGVSKMVLSYIYQYHKIAQSADGQSQFSKYEYMYKKCHQQIQRDSRCILASNEFSKIEKIKVFFEMMSLGAILVYFTTLWSPRIKFFISKIINNRK